MSKILVETKSEECLPFKKSRIVKSLIDEVPDIKESEAVKIARSVERRVKNWKGDVITTSEIRTMVQDQLLKREKFEEASQYEVIGVPVADIKTFLGERQNDNANATFNPESVAKYLSDSVLKEYALQHIVPSDIGRKHVLGDFHIHDLNYFPARLNCMSHDPRFFFEKGLMVDGTGTHTSYAAPPKNLIAVINWLGQIIGTGQCQFAGAQGISAINTFLAPFVVGMTRKDIKQCMQSFIFNLCLSYVSRGGESLSYEERIIVKSSDEIHSVKIGEFCEHWNPKGCQTLSLNRDNGAYEWKNILGGVIHENAQKLLKTVLSDGRSVVTTKDHSLFSYNEDAQIIEVSPDTSPETILTVKKIPVNSTKEVINEDEAFLLGVCIGDGSLSDNNGVPNSQMRIFLNKNEEKTQERISKIVDTKSTWRPIREGNNGVKITFPIKNPLLKKIGKRNKKQIPEEVLLSEEKIILSLLDGLICSDGNISRNRIEFNTASRQLSDQIQFLLLRLGLEFNIRERNSSTNFNRNYPTITIQVSASSSQKLNVTEPKKRPNKFSSISQQRHDYSIIKEALNRPKRLLGGITWKKRAQWAKGRKLKYNGLEANSQHYPQLWKKVSKSLPMEVREIKEISKEKRVYDISVEDNENFVLPNGIVAHNTAFSNLNVELCGVPPFMMDLPAIGKEGKEVGTYSDYIEEAQLITEILIEVLMEGDGHGRFHIMPNTAFVVRDSCKSERYNELLFKAHELAAKFPTPYFLNPEIEGEGGHNVTWGCRSTISSNWTGDPEIDTLRCGNTSFVTLNLPRYAFLEKDIDGVLNKVEENMEMAKEVMALRVDIFNKNVENGMMKFLSQKDKNGEPYYKIENGTHSFGFVGIEEMLLNLGIEEGLLNNEGQNEAVKVLQFMNKTKDEWKEQDNIRYSLLASPAESASGRLASLDIKHYDIKNYNGPEETPYYTNSSHLNVNRDVDLLDRIKIESKFHKLIGGGQILHLWLGTKPNAECLNDLSRIVKNHDARYWTYTNDYSTCTSCNYSYNGLDEICPSCGSNHTIGYSKISGYIQKVENWNRSKRSELIDRYRY